ncbi:MAG: hypothetical protein H7124_06640, partial [Phycisphaerales bacterium]|nr:hypothetical protein [Hyphomonadaceae bacterium]
MAPPTPPPIAASATAFQENLSWMPVATPTPWLAIEPAAPAIALPATMAVLALTPRPLSILIIGMRVMTVTAIAITTSNT